MLFVVYQKRFVHVGAMTKKLKIITINAPINLTARALFFLADFFHYESDWAHESRLFWGP